MGLYKEYIDFLTCPFCDTSTIYHDTWTIEDPYIQEGNTVPEVLEYIGKIYCCKCGIAKLFISKTSEQDVISKLVMFWERGSK